MWVFDGEEWTKDDGSVTSPGKKTDPARPRFDEYTPELQVIEIVPLRKREPIPPFPMP